MSRLRALAITTVAACGGAPEAPAVTSRAASPIATPASPADTVVAQVNGRPVFASCVAAQGARTGAARSALDECIAFELLAQEAERRGLADTDEIVDATRSALVNRVVELEFEQRYQKPADLGDRLTKWLADNAHRMHRPELRASAYARIEIPRDAPADVDRAAQAAARTIYESVAGERGLFAVNLEEAAKAVPVGALKLLTSPVPDRAREQLDKSYADVLWAIPEVGRVAPPVRTPWGWDVILYTGGMPAKETSADELAAQAFPDLKRSLFPIWLSQVARELGVRPVLDKAGVAKLDEVGP